MSICHRLWQAVKHFGWKWGVGEPETVMSADVTHTADCVCGATDVLHCLALMDVENSRQLKWHELEKNENTFCFNTEKNSLLSAQDGYI